jgi:hypothetical protein
MTDPQVPAALAIVVAAGLMLLREPLRALVRHVTGGSRLKTARASGPVSGCAGCKVGCGKPTC